MKAVNLIPADLRGGASAPGRTGNAVHLILGALGVLVIMVSAWTVAGRQVADRQTDLNKARAEAAEATARAGLLEPYTKFADVRRKRVETVTSLSRSRFNWPHALREVSRVTPEDVWLSQLNGSVAPGVAVEGGGTNNPLRGAVKSPAIEITGCTTAQDNVARYIAGLRRVEGVTRVSLAQSEKLESAGAPSTGGAPKAQSAVTGSGDDCRQGDNRYPKFDLVVFFETSTATASGPATTAAPAAPSNGATPSGAGNGTSNSSAGGVK